MLLQEEQVIPILHQVARVYCRMFSFVEENELVNEAFMGKVQNLTDINHVYVAARCDIIDYLRKIRRYNIKNEKLPDEIECIAEDECNKSELKELLDTMMTHTQMSLKDKTIVFLYYYKGMTLEEIGKTLGISKSAVVYHHSKIIQRLQETAVCLLWQEQGLILNM